MCQSYNLTDSIEHFFFYCDCVHSLWNVVKILSKKVLNLHFNCTVLEVLQKVFHAKETVPYIC